jgi:DNA-directed RNA polymerase subunit RPC12/RpoP
MGIIQDLYGLPPANYAFIQCQVCGNDFRWGKRGVVEGVIRCPHCGARITRPKYVDKVHYKEWATRMDKMGITASKLQQRLWNLTNTDENVF